MALRGSALARQLRLGGCRVAADHPVATCPLGDVKRLVGGLHQGFAAVAVPREDGDAQAEREIRNRLAIEHDGLAGHRSPDPLGNRDSCPVAAVKHHAKPVYGLQFHPEVSHTPFGNQILHNFLYNICGCKGLWKLESFIEQTVTRVRKQVGDAKVICGRR